MATFQEFQTISANWAKVDKAINVPLLPHEQGKIRECLALLDDIEPIIQTISTRNNQAGNDLGKANTDRRNRLNALTEKHIQQEATNIQHKFQQFNELMSQLTTDVGQLISLVKLLDEIHPTVNDISFLSSSAAEQLGERFLHFLKQIHAVSLSRSASEFRPTGRANKQEVDHVLARLADFDDVFQDLKTGTDSRQVEHAMSLLNDVSQLVNSIGKDDPEFGNQLSIAHKERMEKLKIADLTENLIAIQTYFFEFDVLHPSLHPSDMTAINNGIRILNEASPKINSVGQNHPIKGNELAHAYNIRMNAVTLIGEKATENAKKQ